MCLSENGEGFRFFQVCWQAGKLLWALWKTISYIQHDGTQMNQQFYYYMLPRGNGMYTHTYLQEDGSISGDTMRMLYTFKAKCRESQIFDMCCNLVNFKDI